MNKTKNDKEILLKSLAHLNVVYLLNKDNNTYEDFKKDNIKLDSSIFHLTQVGELCTKYSDIFRVNHPQIDYRSIIGLRNVMVHGYGTLKYEDIFTIIKEDVPNLINKYKEILNNEYNYINIDKYINNYYDTRKFDKEYE